MQDIQQTYSEGEYKKHTIDEKKDVQSFTVTSAQKTPLYIILLVFILLFTIAITTGICFPSIEIAGYILPILVLFIPAIILAIIFLGEQKVLNLYSNKLTMQGNMGEVAINFTDIKAYGIQSGRGSVFVTIKLSSNKNIKVYSISGKGLIEFYSLFDAKMKLLIKEEHYLIHKITDWPSIIGLTLLGITFLIILFKLLNLI